MHKSTAGPLLPGARVYHPFLKLFGTVTDITTVTLTHAPDLIFQALQDFFPAAERDPRRVRVRFDGREEESVFIPDVAKLQVVARTS